MNLKNAIKHFHKINKHRYYVCKNCFKAKQYKRGLLHDLSKYSPIEFFESVKYYDGKISPIEKCKAENGWSKAWLHHRGRNKHHWEYWIDNINNGYPEAILMPYEYIVEMLCDYIGAGQAYQGKDWTPQKEYEWWNKKRKQVLLHPLTEYFISRVLFQMIIDTDKPYSYYLNPNNLKEIYNIGFSYYGMLPNHYRSVKYDKSMED